MELKEAVREFVFDYFVIITGTVIATLVFCLIFAADSVFGLNYFVQVLLFGLAGDLPIFVFYSKRELSRKEWILRRILHFLLLEVVLLIAGRHIGMYDTLVEGIGFFVTVIGVYMLVWFFSWRYDQQQAEKMNQSLEKLK